MNNEIAKLRMEVRDLRKELFQFRQEFKRAMAVKPVQHVAETIRIDNHQPRRLPELTRIKGNP